jgi:hypothetical protein
MKQSQGENPLESDIACTIEVPTTPEYIMPTSIVAVVSSGDISHLSPLSGFSAAHYTLARLSKVEDGNVLEILDGKTWRVNEVPSIEQLHDRSWEMVVLKSFCGTLQETLDNIFPGSDVDMNYDPLKPTANDVEVWGPDQAKKLYELCFVQRAKTMVRKGWPVAAAYYAYHLETMDGPATRSHCLDDFDQRILSNTNSDETRLCSSHITLCSGGGKSVNFTIHHVVINDLVQDRLRSIGQFRVWKVAYALRKLRDQCYAPDSLIASFAESIERILVEADQSVRFDIDNSDNQGEWKFYSILMLCYGYQAELSPNTTAYLDAVLLGPDNRVLLVFKSSDGMLYPRELMVCDLPRLSDFGITLDLSAFDNVLREVDALESSDQQSAIIWYGCTFSACYKKFGSTHDWRLHEHNSHFQQECWKCNLCSRLDYQKVGFTTHLHNDHTLSTKKIQQLQQKQRIGRNHQISFWCGFCEKIVALQNKGLHAEDERIDHIEKHYLDGEVIQDWTEMDSRGVKGDNWDSTPLLSRSLSPCLT